MATGTRNKRTTQKDIRARLLGKVDQQAAHLAGLVGHVDTIAAATVDAAGEVEELKALGLTLSEMEEATGISVYRLTTMTRHAREHSDAGREADAVALNTDESSEISSEKGQDSVDRLSGTETGVSRGAADTSIESAHR